MSLTNEDFDVARRDFDAAVLQPRLIGGEEADHPAAGPDPAGIDLRQLLIESLHPELMQVDLRQFSAEFAARGGIKLDIGGSN
jgi:hypothetical protein